MLAINYSTLKNNLKDYCDEASDNNQTIIVTRKKAKSIVIMSLDNYNQLMKSLAMQNTLLSLIEVWSKSRAALVKYMKKRTFRL